MTNVTLGTWASEHSQVTPILSWRSLKQDELCVCGGGVEVGVVPCLSDSAEGASGF